jgi:hypothetical protein
MASGKKAPLRCQENLLPPRKKQLDAQLLLQVADRMVIPAGYIIAGCFGKVVTLGGGIKYRSCSLSFYHLVILSYHRPDLSQRRLLCIIGFAICIKTIVISFFES